jgi:hypothetical protein
MEAAPGIKPSERHLSQVPSSEYVIANDFMITPEQPTIMLASPFNGVGQSPSTFVAMPSIRRLDVPSIPITSV